jgi:leucyl/phenylalanyl-tRNA--protein transferase
MPVAASKSDVQLLNQSNPAFPDPSSATDDGLVAVGGELSVEWLLAAYRRGIFPWTVRPITWWSPDPRGIFELGGLHISKSLAKILRREIFQVTIDRAFREVMEGCARPGPGRGKTWITREFIEAYVRLHRAGHAHSVECWQDDELVGGIYGVALGGLFAGESMFHRADNASKVVLCHLVNHLRERKFALFDIQMVTPITRQLGAIEIPRTDYLQRLAAAVKMNCKFTL